MSCGQCLAATVTPSCDRLLSAFVAPDELKRDLHKTEQLRIGTLNATDLYLEGSLAGLSPAKTPEQLEVLSHTILKANVDLLVLQEVVSPKVIETFIEQHLKDQYDYVFIEGNDSWGRGMAFLIKKDLPLHMNVFSHAREEWMHPVLGRPTRVFSRDLPLVEFRSVSQSEGDSPLLTVLGAHASSFIAGDPIRTLQREAQVQRTTEILQAYMTKYGRKPPVALAGDFNTSISKLQNFESFRALGMKDAAEISSVPPAHRATHVQGSQIDGILVNSVLNAESAQGPLVKSSKVHRYQDRFGKTVELDPRRKDLFPSTHFLVTADIKLGPLLALAGETPGSKVLKMPAAIPKPEPRVVPKTATSAPKLVLVPLVGEPKAPGPVDVARRLNQFIEERYFTEDVLRLPDSETELGQLVKGMNQNTEFWSALDFDAAMLLNEANSQLTKRTAVSGSSAKPRDPFIDQLDLPERDRDVLRSLNISDFARGDIAELSEKDKVRLFEQVFLKLSLNPRAAIWNDWGTDRKLGSLVMSVRNGEYRVIFDKVQDKPRVLLIGPPEKLKELPPRLRELDKP